GGVGEDPLACTLPGLVVGPSLAVAVSESLKRAGLRRRRRRRANTPSPGLHRRDPFATQLTRRVDRYARARADLAAPRRAASTVAVGFRDAEELTVDLAELGLLALCGPAAADAARLLATSFLAQTGAGGGQAVVVGDLLPPAQAFPGLSQPRDLGTALQELAEQPSAPGPSGLASGEPGSARVLLVTREGSPEDLAELTRLLGDGGGGRLLPVLVDAVAERATTVRIEANERVAEVTVPDDAAPGAHALADRLVGARLYTLGREAASELLAVLSSARTDDDVVTAVVEEAEPFEVVMAEAPCVSVQLLGTYRLEVGGVEIRAGLRAKARELLAFYLLHPAGTTLD
ncbi:MAG: hypothetical protein LC708_04300, partial [Actinobacteria bacterium]|nr:hypothetical protein [Actinomycetota bacterium]